jgi:hypothetical protein
MDRMKVFLTVDTETWPRNPDWLQSNLEADIERDIYGATCAGRFGIDYQMDILTAHGLKAVFFVESLFACAVGLGPLRKIVAGIQKSGHEVQLHAHPEWLAWMPRPLLAGRVGQYLKDFSFSEQVVLLREACGNLRGSGVPDVCAFRAGNYGADFNTLRALVSCHIHYDTSYNPCYLDSDCGLRMDHLLIQPEILEGIWELPISFFRDFPGHYRHAQLCACSSGEMERALLQAWRRGWRTFVIVSHSVELIKNRKQVAQPPSPDGIVIGRFERLCRFLARHTDKFVTSGFHDLDPRDLAPPQPTTQPLRSTLPATAWRFAEQLARRVSR